MIPGGYESCADVKLKAKVEQLIKWQSHKFELI